MVCNACLLQRRLRNEPQMKTILRLDKVSGASSPGKVLVTAWKSILEKDYSPVFRPALAVLGALPEGKAIGDAIRVVAECANRVADSLSELGYDHAGPLYHRILGSAKSDGAFYTNNLSAVMLARLALTDSLIDWSDPREVSKLRIIDPACGTGTLLMACLQTIKARIAENPGGGGGGESDEQRNTIHKRIVEEVLCGLDINQHGIQLAACNMTLGAPTVDYERMNLVTMPHGPQGDGSAKAGSLEILATAGRAEDLTALTAPRRSLETLDAAQVNESKETRFPLRDLDGVIMNAPFTDNKKRGRKFGKAVLRQMQRHELHIRNQLLLRDPKAGEVITTNSISTFFTPLADQVVGAQHGRFVAKVLPVTGCTGASGLAERRFLAERFHIERIVTTHDPRRIAFSENTSIHESLLICRRHPNEGRPPTEFVALRKMPESPEEAITIADAILNGQAKAWGQVCRWPTERVAAGDWTPAQWYDETLAEIVRHLEKHGNLGPAGLVLTMGATGRAAQDSWKRNTQGEHPQSVWIFDTVSAGIRRTMLDEPEQLVVPGGRRAHLFNRVRRTKGHLMLATRYDTVSGRLTALWTETATFGFGWIPSTGPSRAYEKAVCAWWNSTPGRLLLLNRRAKKLTYPKWSKKHLNSLPCPKLGAPGCEALTRAWEQTKQTHLLPLQHSEECAARRVIDEAAAMAIGVEAGEIADWRQRLAAEPTITNARAPRSSKGRG